MTLQDLAKEGWIASTSLKKEEELTEDEVNELVFCTWGWAKKLRIKNLQQNPYLLERVNSINFDEVYSKRKERLSKITH